MKLSALFAKYLYQHRQLNLPGIGTFSIDPAVTVPDTHDKMFPEFLQQIKYQPKNIISADDEFINFIRTETGKIRPLAESDLDSFLSDGKILLNIGKPFHIEGIGSILKNKAGLLEFTPGEPVFMRLESYNNEPKEENNRRKTLFTDDSTQPNGLRKLLIAAAVIVGIILVIWLGYSLYNRNVNEPINSDTIAIAPDDTAKANIILDSVQKIIDSAKASAVVENADTYKFIIEKTANKLRAQKRFVQIKDNRTDIKMEPNTDSTLFSLYFVLPATPADTARIRDSLKLWYGRKQVWIEK